MDNLFLSVLSISFTTSVVIVAVIMLGTLINKRYVAKWKYLLWIFLALRLLIPFNFKLSDIQIRIQIPAEVGNMEMADILGLEPPISVEHFMEPQTLEVLYSKPETSDSPSIKADIRKELHFSFTLLQVLGYVWIAGAIGLFLWQLTGFFCYKRGILRRGRKVRNPVLIAQLRGLRREFGIRKNITFIIYKKADSPMVVGFWHPVLVLPKEDYTRDESYYILRHELIHLRRHDVLVRFLLLLARDFHWFNPVVYLMHREAVVDMELACDEAVVRGSSYDQREAYTETLLSTLSSRQHKGPLLSTQFSGGKRVMKKRFKNILTKVKKKNGIILFAVILLLTVTVGTLTTLVVEATTVDGAGGDEPGLNTAESDDVSDENGISDENDSFDENIRESSAILTLIKEGMEEEVPATLYIGEGYSFYLIDGQWVMTEPGSWYAKVNENVRLWIDRYEGLNLNLVEEMLAGQGYSVEDDGPSGRLYKYEKKTGTVSRVLCYETESDVWTMNSVHSIGGEEGWAVDIRAMFDTFAVTEGYEGISRDIGLIDEGIFDNVHNIYSGNIGNEEIRMIITRTGDSLYAAYTTRSGEGKVFQGNLADNAAGFALNTDDGEYLNGIITRTDDGYIIIKGDGVLSQNRVTFTLYQESFIMAGDELGNYYAVYGYDAEEVEQFARQIKVTVSDKTAFAGLIQYPISVELDGSRIIIENEEVMISIYDRLMEQSGLRQQIENIFTKYMFSNYEGICVEDGILWFSKDAAGDYKIIDINPPRAPEAHSNG